MELDEKPLDYEKIIRRLHDGAVKNILDSNFDDIIQYKWSMGYKSALDNLLNEIKIEKEKRLNRFK